MVFSHASKNQRDEASQPQQDIIIGLHDASWRAKLESNDYPILQRSMVKLLDICIHTMLRT